MQTRRDELFTGPALANHEHRFDELGGARDMLEHGSERWRLADQTDTFRRGCRDSAGQVAPTVGRLDEILAQDQTRTQAPVSRERRKLFIYQ
jgi:hypothetical protein